MERPAAWDGAEAINAAPSETVRVAMAVMAVFDKIFIFVFLSGRLLRLGSLTGRKSGRSLSMTQQCNKAREEYVHSGTRSNKYNYFKWLI